MEKESVIFDIYPVRQLKTKVADYAQLMKLRLSFLVVFSAAMAYLWECNRLVNPLIIWLLSVGGFLITGAANTMNQIIERDSDKLMKRTCYRPLSSGRMEVSEALTFAFITGGTGLILLLIINGLCALLGIAAMALYAGIYTPLKKVNRLVILPGAIAGSLPVVIGCTAAAGKISAGAILLFAVQFLWQFPHTWSIAWLLDEEYAKAGIKMMPSAGGRTRLSAIIIMVSTFLIIPAGLLLHLYHPLSETVIWLIALAGSGLALSAFRLWRNLTQKSALFLMFGSFAYLPFVLIVLIIAKFL